MTNSFFFLFSIGSYSQNEIKGTVKDSLGISIEFANVILVYSNDSTIAYGAMSNEKGSFIITNVKTGKFRLQASYIGFKDSESLDITITDNSQKIDVGEIFLLEDSISLDDVVITGNKLKYKQEADKTIVNLGEQNTSSALSLLNILENSPNVTIDNLGDEIILNGKSNVIIAINSREIKLPKEALTQFLNSINSEDIESIELISNPPANYDANAKGGVINIIMRRGIDSGSNGKAYSNLGYGLREKAGFGGNINFSSPKINYGISLRREINKTKESWLLGRNLNFSDQETITQANSFRTPDLTTWSGSMFFEKTGKVNTIGMSVMGQQRLWDMNANNITTVNEENQRFLINSTDLELDKWNNILSTIYYSRKKKDNSLDISLNYLYYKNENNHAYVNDFFSQDLFQNQNQVLIDKDTPIKIFTSSISYLKEKESFSYSVGGKFSNSSLSNVIDVIEIIENVSSIDKNFTENSYFNENNYALFSSISKQIGKINFQGGMRVEWLKTKLIDNIEGFELIDRNLFNVFPNINLDYEINKTSQVSFIYNKRIERPRFVDLAPFVVFLGPRTYYNGNINLQPSLINVFKLFYQNGANNFSLEYSPQKNTMVSYQPFIDPNEDVLVVKPINYDKTYMFDFTFSRRFQYNWLEFNILLSAGYQGLTTQLDNDTNISYNQFYSKINTNINFNFQNGLSIVLSTSTLSPFYSGIVFKETPGQIDILLKKEILKNVSLSFVAKDIFNNNDWRLRSEWSELFLQTNEVYDFETRTFMMSLSYSFGSGNKKNNRTNDGPSMEDRKRVE